MIVMDDAGDLSLLSLALAQPQSIAHSYMRMWKLLEAVKLLHRKGLAHGGLHAELVRVCAESPDRLMIIGFSNTKPIENPASVEDDMLYIAMLASAESPRSAWFTRLGLAAQFNSPHAAYSDLFRLFSQWPSWGATTKLRPPSPSSAVITRWLEFSRKAPTSVWRSVLLTLHQAPRRRPRQGYPEYSRKYSLPSEVTKAQISNLGVSAEAQSDYNTILDSIGATQTSSGQPKPEAKCNKQDNKAQAIHDVRQRLDHFIKWVRELASPTERAEVMTATIAALRKVPGAASLPMFAIYAEELRKIATDH
jgi:hypothetical protein